MQHVVDTYQGEWETAIEDPETARRFRTFVNNDQPDPSIVKIPLRKQHRPATWDEKAPSLAASAMLSVMPGEELAR